MLLIGLLLQKFNEKLLPCLPFCPPRELLSESEKLFTARSQSSSTMATDTLTRPGNDVAVTLIKEVFSQQYAAESAVEEKSELSLKPSGTFVVFNNLTLMQETLGIKPTGLLSKEEPKQEVLGLISKLTALAGEADKDLTSLEEHLLSRTFFINNCFTALDLIAYTYLHPYISAASHQDLLRHPSVTRHFDLIQNLPDVRNAIQRNPAISLPLVSINLADVPEAEQKPMASNKKDKKAKPTAAEAGAGKDSSSAEASTGSKPKKAEKKKGDSDKKDKQTAGSNDNKKPSAPTDAPPMPHMIDMRIGKIVQIEKHPDADSLYVEKIDFGESEPRTVISGLVNHIPIEEMRDRLLVGICNLKPVNMRGIKSFAMVLCATAKDKKEGERNIELVAPPPGSQPGDRVYFEGFEKETPLEQLNPKKKQFESIQPNFTTMSTKEACWIDPQNGGKAHRIMTAKGVCCAPSFVGASLS
ncbi:hypothetical protein O181_093136 [Austropuccinia psidii MF-1]|uniref:tRNA-binding domain-containing protein n=1 Tax=Austropuccinia psidii MF-1 TaxID=1389203 RepID=A0A9Q3J0P4_9BASI|nr:hypothetical protein [Austropuccinia psidii MF-1]